MNSLEITGPLVQHMTRPWQSVLHHSLGPSTCEWLAPCAPDGGVVPAGVVVSQCLELAVAMHERADV